MYNDLNSTMYGMARDGPEKENETKKFVKKQIREALDQNPKFKAFLKQNHVEGRFIRNITKRILEYSDIEYGLTFRIDTIKSDADVINLSFSWLHTPEGHNFWSSLNEKYNREINSK